MKKQSKCELCKNNTATLLIKEKYGAKDSDVDTYRVCQDCRKIEEKICINWGYGFSSEILQKES